MRIYTFLLLFFCCSTFAGAQDFYKWDKIQEIKIYFERDNWAEILTKLKSANNKKRMTAKMVVNGKTYNEVGVRFKGNSSFKNVKKGGSKKLPFNIELNYKSDQRLDDKWETVKLSNVFRDPTFVRELLTYEIARKYLYAPKCNFAKLYINDKYIGLYNNTESIDDRFLKKHFGSKKGILVKCDPEWGLKTPPNCKKGDKSSMMYLGDSPACYYSNYEMKSSDDGWKPFIKMIEVLNEKDNAIANHLDIDQTLWMHAFNNVLVNLDSYTGRLSHNYYMYKGEEGKFMPLVWDMNLSFGAFKFDGNGKPLDNRGLQRLSPMVHFKNKNQKRPLLVNLLQNSLWRKIYMAHVKTILEENFANGEYKQRAKEIQAVIRTEVQNDPNKLYSFDAFTANIDATTDAGGTPIIGLTELMEARVEYLEAHPLLNNEAPSVTKVEDIHFGDDSAIQAHLEGATKAYAYYRTSKQAPFKRFKMKDDGGSNDESMEDGIWGCTVPFAEKGSYYIVAENEKAVSCFPTRTSRKPIKLKQ